ncbi:galanin receptor 2a [Nematostella vectensis]|uniref:galanin receptor 2a n=1 Tax=Nematostella vectensis TaxID=45351 RepID=UPI002076EED2|nr:galanin receptor 2a [Nematostella vectensis]
MNTSNNISTNVSEVTHVLLSDTVEFKVFKILLYSLILLASTLGNGLVIHVIRNTERMWTPSNVLIMNLAVCDIITPVLSILFDLPLEENEYKWIYGGFMCKVLWPGSTFSTTSSSLTLAAISMDRYRVIMHPFKSKLSMDQVKIMISLIHLFALAVVTPYIYVLRLGEDGRCDETWSADSAYRKVYTMVLFLVQYCIPLIFMTIMYTMTLKSLYSASLKTWVMRLDHVEEDASLHVVSESSSTDSCHSGKQKKKKKKRAFFHVGSGVVSETNRRATKMFMVVVFVFATCMFPNQVMWLWNDYGEELQARHRIITIICLMFTYANSVCNPVIYAFFSADFKKGFYGVYGKLCCKTIDEYDLTAHNSQYVGSHYNQSRTQC